MSDKIQSKKFHSFSLLGCQRPFLLSLSTILIVFGLLEGRPILWSKNGPSFFYGSTILPIALGTVGIIWVFSERKFLSYFGLKSRDTQATTIKYPSISTNIIYSVTGSSFGFLLVILSDWVTRDYSLFRGTYCRIEAILTGFVVFLLYHRGKKCQKKALCYLPVLGALTAFISFILYCNGNGARLISDDHSVFFYRLQLLKDEFPFIPFYYPKWNAGIDARDFFASGSINLFLLFYPIISLTNLWDSYSIIVALTLFFVTPASMWFASRLLGLSKISASISATLSLGASLFWYRWSLAYGTMGFITSSALAPLCWAIWYRIAELIKPPALADQAKLTDSKKTKVRLSWTISIAAIFVTTLVSFWSLAPISLIPILILVAPTLLRSLLNRGDNRKKMVTILFFLLVINLPWMVLFVSVSKVTSFITSESKGVVTSGSYLNNQSNTETLDIKNPHPINLNKGENGSNSRSALMNSYRHQVEQVSINGASKHLREWAITVNPLLFTIGLFGLFLFKPKLRLFFITQSVWLIFLGTFIVTIKPQLELDRMLILLAQFLCIPTGLAMRFGMRGRSIHQLGKSKFPKFIRNLSLLTTFAFLFLTPLYTSAIATNRSMERFHLSSKNFNEIPGIITEYSGSGRTLFSGHVLHELDGGHLAPLTILTNKPLIASSQVHNLWHYKQIVPSEFLSKGDEGIEQYFDLMNVTLVFAHENSWKRWFEERYERYKPVYDGDPFSGYIRLKARNSYFIEGDGSVTAQTNDEIVFTPTTTSGVLSFSWFPFLKASTCKLTPKDFGEEVTLIKFDECQPDKPVVIKSVSSINRIM